MLTNTPNDGNNPEQATGEVVGYGGLSGGVIANRMFPVPSLPTVDFPTRSSGEEIPQIRLLPLPIVPLGR